MAKISKYGSNFSQPELSHSELELEIELHMIRKLYFDGDKAQLLQHYLNAHKYLWPEDKQHRWFLLGMKSIVENKISVFLGCANSGKTYLMSCHGLIDFWAFPQTSLSLISSTDIRSLELRIWGRGVKYLFNRARGRFPNLAGVILESKMAIVPDEVDEEGVFAREIDKGLVCVPCVSGGKFIGMSKFQGVKPPNSPGKHDGILKHYGDECFPAGTLVDTPRGQVPIEKIQSGDLVFSATGVGRVKATMSRTSDSLVKIKTKDGREIDCTQNHPFFTKSGWKSACHLRSNDYIMSQHETMLILQKGLQAVLESKNLLDVFKNTLDVRNVQAAVPAKKTTPTEHSFLQPVMQIEMDSKSSVKAEGLRDLWGKFRGFWKHEGVPALPINSNRGGVQNVREYLSESRIEQKVKVLREILRVEVSATRPGISKEILYQKSVFKNPENEKGSLRKASRGISKYAAQNGVRFSAVQAFTFGGSKTVHSRFNFSTPEIHWTQAAHPWRKRIGADKRGSHAVEGVPRIEEQFPNTNQNEGWKRLSDLLQGGYCVSEHTASGGGRRRVARENRSTASGRKENQFLDGDWVDSVEVVKCEDFGRYGKCGDGVKVYNLEIEGHPSYSVSGFAVHNCAVMQPSLLDGYTNWTSNENFKGIMSANPTDISDPACVASEPVGGWDTFQDDCKTQIWRSRWHGAFVVAFDGRDTPNNDEPKNQFKFLARSDFVQKLIDTYGADSWQVYQQGIGKPSRGMVSNRVITIGMCETGKAFDSAQWLNNEFTDIYALDPAFGGGDRCVGGRVRMGTFIDGTKGIEVFAPTIIPISLNSGVDPQDQIAQYVFDDATELGIAGENCFFDSFGRGTLHNHFGKFFGVNLPIAVDSGARPTTRPVRQGLYVTDKSGERRLKRCDEEYSKFVTELWFSTREAIRMQQIRGLPKNVAYEGQLRMFKIVAGNRTEVEPKDDMKERTGKSPDLYDWFAIAIEGCRQRGFEIKGIGSDAPKSKGKSEEDWFDTEVNSWNNAISAGLLRH